LIYVILNYNLSLLHSKSIVHLLNTIDSRALEAVCSNLLGFCGTILDKPSQTLFLDFAIILLFYCIYMLYMLIFQPKETLSII